MLNLSLTVRIVLVSATLVSSAVVSRQSISASLQNLTTKAAPSVTDQLASHDYQNYLTILEQAKAKLGNNSYPESDIVYGADGQIVRVNGQLPPGLLTNPYNSWVVPSGAFTAKPKTTSSVVAMSQPSSTPSPTASFSNQSSVGGSNQISQSTLQTAAQIAQPKETLETVAQSPIPAPSVAPLIKQTPIKKVVPQKVVTKVQPTSAPVVAPASSTAPSPPQEEPKKEEKHEEKKEEKQEQKQEQKENKSEEHSNKNKKG